MAIDENIIREVEHCARAKFDVAGVPVRADIEGCLQKRVDREPAFIAALATQIEQSHQNVAAQLPEFNACLSRTQNAFAQCGQCRCEEEKHGSGPAGYAPKGGFVLHFDGRTGHVLVPRTDMLSLKDKVTIEAWVRVEKWFGGQYFPIVDRAWRLEATKDGISFTAAYGSATMTPTELEIGRWTHVAVVYNVHRKVSRWFIDGKQVAEKEYAEAFLESQYDNKMDLHIGAGPTGGKEFAAGYFDEVRLWNVERSAAEIAATMNESLAPNTAGLIGYWKFDEGSGTVASDASGSGHEGQLVGNVQWVKATDTNAP